MLASLVTIHLWGASSNLMLDWCQIVIRTPHLDAGGWGRLPGGRCVVGRLSRRRVERL